MSFFKAIPKDDSSPSRRWFVDELGLEKVKEKYSNYPKNGQTINRWYEYEVTPTQDIWFDFGGMLRVNTPTVKELVCGAYFELIVTHIPIFLETLKSPRLNDGDYWQCGGRFYSYVFSKKVRDRLINSFSVKEKLYAEMIEGFNKEMDEVITNNKHIIAQKKYHKGN